MQVEFHPEARAEIRSGALWYEERRARLGEEFVAAVDATFESIGKAPQMFPRWPGTENAPAIIRKARVERFPYVVAFEQHSRHVLVLAVAHQKRRPLYWLARASQEPG